MKRRFLIFSIVFISSYAYFNPALAQRAGCRETYEDIKKLIDKGDWENAKIECDSYLRHCGTSATVSKMLDDCKVEIQKKNELNRIQKLKKEGKWSDVENACDSYFKKYGSNPQIEQILKDANRQLASINSGNDDIKPVQKPTIRFSVDQKYIEFPEEGGDKLVWVTSDDDWYVVSYPLWIDITQDNDMLVISCDVNYKSSTREEDIILANYSGKELHITVSQDRSKYYLSLSANIIEDVRGAAGKVYTIYVNSNKSWNIKSKPYWCNIEVTGNRLDIRLDQNRTYYERKGEIEICAEQSALRSFIYIEQGVLKNFIFVSPNILNDNDGTGGSGTFHVDTDYDYYYIEDIPSWCEITQKNSSSFVVNIKDNNGGYAREAVCRVVAGEASETFTIKQAERRTYVKVSPNLIKAGKNGGTITIRVESSGTWKIVNLPDWCSVVEEWDSGFKLKVLPNNNSYSRKDTFSVSNSGIRENIVVEQE